MAELFLCDIPIADRKVHSRESAAAEKFARRVLAEKTGLREDDIVFERTGNGKPFISGSEWRFNWSHSGGKIALAVSRREVGVDIQLTGERRQAVERRVFTDAERALIDSAEDENFAFFALWVLKESYLKAIGSGFRGNAKEIEFHCVSPRVVSDSMEYDFVLKECGEYLIAVCEKKIIDAAL